MKWTSACIDQVHAEMSLVLSKNELESWALTEAAFRWCQNPECGAGAIYCDVSSAKPQIECAVCGTKSCFVHKCRWPAERGCDECEEEQLNQGYLHQHTKRCPNCKVPIEKNGGCDSMLCTICQTCFSWNGNLASGSSRGIGGVGVPIAKL
eukprot:TRINITY_DN18161_c0_g1_i1.p2 TRINITY_DN18161_c0_g1~~TRINITY_DN18161_c0_g1_i1.p2  ORF type:complete len:151 (+),score=15.03 TRINITY_DN18161_c0_g1_i1:213-665(+)